MDIKKITDNYSVAGQIGPEDVPLIAATGFKSVICNRPDGEALDQPDYEDHRAGRQDRKDRDALHPDPARHDGSRRYRRRSPRRCEELPGPVLAYCRTRRALDNDFSRRRRPDCG